MYVPHCGKDSLIAAAFEWASRSAVRALLSLNTCMRYPPADVVSDSVGTSSAGRQALGKPDGLDNSHIRPSEEPVDDRDYAVGSFPG